MYRDTTSYHDFPCYYFTKNQVSYVDRYNPETSSYDKFIDSGDDLIELALANIVPVVVDELVDNTKVISKFSESYDISLYNKPTYYQARNLIANSIFIEKYAKGFIKNIFTHIIIRSTPEFVEDLISCM